MLQYRQHHAGPPTVGGYGALSDAQKAEATVAWVALVTAHAAPKVAAPKAAASKAVRAKKEPAAAAKKVAAKK
jgi:hypothetical protein